MLIIPMLLLKALVNLKVQIATAADDNFFFFSEKISLDISCELSAWQTIHMKCQDLLSLKNKKKFLNDVCYKFCFLYSIMGRII